MPCPSFFAYSRQDDIGWKKFHTPALVKNILQFFPKLSIFNSDYKKFNSVISQYRGWCQGGQSGRRLYAYLPGLLHCSVPCLSVIWVWSSQKSRYQCRDHQVGNLEMPTFKTNGRKWEFFALVRPAPPDPSLGNTDMIWPLDLGHTVEIGGIPWLGQDGLVSPAA